MGILSAIIASRVFSSLFPTLMFIGHFCPARASMPLPCPPGTSQSTDNGLVSACTDCVAGQYSFSRSLACEACPAGYMCPQTDLTPQLCPLGTYSDGSDTACTVCNVGYYCQPGSITANPTDSKCPKGNLIYIRCILNSIRILLPTTNSCN